jgi:hypothetical protein
VPIPLLVHSLGQTHIGYPEALLESDHVGLDEARDVILADMLGEQPLHRPQLAAEAVR